ncbi:MAG: MBOAT family O-acyltransferase [Oscillospiraceae bacterium]|nr:MBOAT family O-acyltransferase [Oscillospiraceae bacterium]
MEWCLLVFSSLIFLFLFLPLTLILYLCSSSVNQKNNVLVIMSVIFYAWGEPVYVLLMLFSAFVNYFCGLLMGAARKHSRRKASIVVCVVINLLLLGLFKYTGFLVENLNAITGLSIAAPQISLPIGISFYTFQAMTYSIDVYRGEVKVQRSYRDFLLYLSLFPQLIAGPIVRYSEIEPQLTERRTTMKGAFYGLTRFSFGLGKKVLIANYCGAVAGKMLDGTLSQSTAVGVWLGIAMYTLQIYFDFAGYSDMAIGLGRIFGFKYSENFDLPYTSKSITEFWRRWHISLSSFFRDYVYIPLGGNRKHQMLNLFIVWSLTGLWHGASWNFVLWGMYFFVLLVIEKTIPDRLERIPGFVRHLITLFLLMMGWTLFYCTDLSRLGQTLGCMFGFYGAGFTDYSMGVTLVNNLPLLLLGIVASSSIPRTVGNVFRSLCMRRGSAVAAKKVYVIAVFVLDALLIFASVVSLLGSSYNPFLYFRF